MQKQYASLQEVFKNRISEMNRKNEELQQKIRKLEDFENLKSEGLQRENGLLRERMAVLESDMNWVRETQKKSKSAKNKERTGKKKIVKPLTHIQNALNEISQKI